MAEIEIHHEHAHSADPTGKWVGFLVGVIGVVLAVVTICAHRAHTAAVIHRTEANDQWAYYQAKKIRENTVATASELLGALADGKSGPSEKATKVLEKFSAQREKYVRDADEIQDKAKEKDHETEHDEAFALRFDLGEGLLELGLVLSSLYFLGRQKFFPIIGSIAAIAGVATALSVFALGG